MSSEENKEVKEVIIKNSSVSQGFGFGCGCFLFIIFLLFVLPVSCAILTGARSDGNVGAFPERNYSRVYYPSDDVNKEKDNVDTGTTIIDTGTTIQEQVEEIQKIEITPTPKIEITSAPRTYPLTEDAMSYDEKALYQTYFNWSKYHKDSFTEALRWKDNQKANKHQEAYNYVRNQCLRILNGEYETIVIENIIKQKIEDDSKGKFNSEFVNNFFTSKRQILQSWGRPSSIIRISSFETWEYKNRYTDQITGDKLIVYVNFHEGGAVKDIYETNIREDE